MATLKLYITELSTSLERRVERERYWQLGHPVPVPHVVVFLLGQEVGVGRTLAGMGASLSQELCPQPLVNRVEGGQEI